MTKDDIIMYLEELRDGQNNIETVLTAVEEYCQASNNGKPYVLRRLAYSVKHRLQDEEDQKIFLDEQQAMDYCKANDGYCYSSVELMA